MTAAIEKSSLRRVAAAETEFASDVRRGLTAATRSIPPRWFYDELGSVLFDAICLLPEYYVTRTETEVFEAYASEITAAFDRPQRIIELGSGTARKTRLLLQRLDRCEYIPVDIDCTMVEKTAHKIAEELPHIEVTPVCGDFTDPGSIVASLPPAEGRSVVLFLGSTIGNLDHAAASAMLRAVRQQLREDDRFLLGVDLRKDHAVLHAAYNDALGVTAAFNLNLLQRINRELGGTFDLGAFRHRAVYDEKSGRIEMYLDSTREQRVEIASLAMTVSFREGESIHTENSYKYTLEQLATLAEQTGFSLARSWSDSRGWFADVLLAAT